MATVLAPEKEQMDVVIAGHVDHGKSTVIGRLLADTGSLPECKLEQVKQMCKNNARPFEYAFLLDALKNEQAQGITIDTARCFFHTATRNYIIHDAPGHIEFLKNMVTGAARAQAALLVIDGQEGVQENSKRHGYMISMLGIKQVAILVNKLDLVDYSQEVFNEVRNEYTAFLKRLGVNPLRFIPVSAREGANIAEHQGQMPWYDGPTVLEQIEAFEKPRADESKPFRMPVQDIYKFTAEGDDRRIVAGTVLSGAISVGDDVVFTPSGKTSRVTAIEGFNTAPRTSISAGYATGFTLDTQIYIKPGELMTKKGELEPRTGRRFRCNIFWMGHAPMIQDRKYRMKIGSAIVPAELAEVRNVLDASELSTVENKKQIERHDVAECVLETLRPIAFDLRNQLEVTGRFVIVDDHEIAGCGVILEDAPEGDSVMEKHIRDREFSWEKGKVTPEDRAARFQNKGKLIVLHGVYGCSKRRVAKRLEEVLFERGHLTYYFGISNYFEQLDHDARTYGMGREAHLEQLGQLARVLTDAGILLLTTVAEADDFDLEKLKVVAGPEGLFVVNLGENVFSNFPVDVQLPYRPDMDHAIEAIMKQLQAEGVIVES